MYTKLYYNDEWMMGMFHLKEKEVKEGKKDLKFRFVSLYSTFHGQPVQESLLLDLYFVPF